MLRFAGVLRQARCYHVHNNKGGRNREFLYILKRIACKVFSSLECQLFDHLEYSLDSRDFKKKFVPHLTELLTIGNGKNNYWSEAKVLKCISNHIVDILKY